MHKYSKYNWETWKSLIKQSHDDFTDNPCSYCQFSMPDKSIKVCASTHYGIDTNLITPEMKIQCDFNLDINTYIKIGESGMYEDYSNYIESIF